MERGIKNIKICILTVDRQPNYIDECIRTIRQGYKGIIHLMIGGKNYSYVDKYDKGFVKHYVDEKGIEENWKRACKGYAQCLRLGIEEGVLIIEDDTTFKRGWYKQFQRFLVSIQDEKFILSLGNAMSGSVANPDMKIPSVQKFLYRVNLSKNPNSNQIPLALIQCWYDSHAVYYPSALPIQDMANCMEYFGIEKSSMHDLIIGYYAFRKLYPIYITVPNWAINVGAHNTHVGRIKNLNQDMTEWDYSD